METDQLFLLPGLSPSLPLLPSFLPSLLPLLPPSLSRCFLLSSPPSIHPPGALRPCFSARPRLFCPAYSGRSWGIWGPLPPPDFKSERRRSARNLTNRSLSPRPSNQSEGAQISHRITNSPSCIMHAAALRVCGGNAEGCSRSRVAQGARGAGRGARGGPGARSSCQGPARHLSLLGTHLPALPSLGTPPLAPVPRSERFLCKKQ